MQRTIFGKRIYLPLDAYKTTRRIEIHILKKYLDVQPSDIMCDIGSGTGYWTEHIGGPAFTVGLDIMWRDTAIAAREHSGPHVQYVLGNAERLPFADQAFTKIFGVCSFEHIPDNRAAFSEFNRCIKPGGVLALTLDSLNYHKISDERRREHAERYYVAHLYNVNNVTALLHDHDFVVTDTRYLLASPISHHVNLLVDRYRRLHYPFFPVTYPLTLASDRLFGRKDEGWKLAVRAVKKH